MAFMMPVMRNDYDIYKGGKQKRTISESSTISTSTTGTAGSRSRKISHNSRSECPSLSSSPGAADFVSPRRHHSQPHNMSMARQQFARSASRTSQTSLGQSPIKNGGSSSCRSSTGCSPPKPAASESSLSKFHSRLVDKLRRSLKKSSSADDRS